MYDCVVEICYCDNGDMQECLVNFQVDMDSEMEVMDCYTFD